MRFSWHFPRVFPFALAMTILLTGALLALSACQKSGKGGDEPGARKKGPAREAASAEHGTKPQKNAVGHENGGVSKNTVVPTNVVPKNTVARKKAKRATLFGKPGDVRPLDSYLVGNYSIGGDFALLNQDGRKTSLSDLKGKVVLITFGYTHCEDVCPVTVATMGRALKGLKDKASRAQMVFVTVDPERDTPETIKAYLASFPPGIIGLTGPLGEIERMVKKYQGIFRKLGKKASGGYLVGHTGFYYLLSQNGKLRYMFPHDTPLGTMLQGLETLLATAS